MVDQADRRAQALRVADAIIGLLRTYRREPVIFFKSLDRIQIALGEPFALRASSIDAPGSQFDTIGNRVVSAETEPVVFAGALSLQLLRTRRTETKEQSDAALARGASFLRLLSATLSNSRGGPTSLRPALLKGLASAIESVDLGGSEEIPVVSSPADASPHDDLASFFSELESFLTRGDYQISLPGEAADSRCPRFLVFHRYADGSGQLRSRLHLFECQRRLFEERLASLQDRADPDEGADSLDVRSLIESALGPPWNIETGFSSGVTSWIDWPWDQLEDELLSREALTFRSLLRSLGNAGLAGRSTPQAIIPPALAVPVHVGGLPWLMLVAIFAPEESERTTWAEYFYRDLLPYITTTVRQLAERTFLAEIRNKAKKTLRAGRTDLHGVNDALRSLTYTLPFPPVELTRRAPGIHTEWQGEAVYIPQSRNLPLGQGSPQVNYTLPDPSLIPKALDDAQAEFAGEQARQLKQRMSSYVAIGHTLKNVVSVTGWATAASRVAQARKDMDALQSGVRAAGDARSRLTRAFQSADRTLSLFAIVGGLGHFIRLAGAQSGQFEWRKFAGWLSPSPSEVASSADVVGAYARSIFLIAQVVAFGRSWRDVQVETPTETLRWLGGSQPALSIPNLHFPPFARGAEVAFPMIFCLVEPMVNAIAALEKFKPQDIKNLGSAPFRIIVTIGSSEPQDIRVEFLNFSRQAKQPRTTGWDVTLSMLKDMGLGEFDEEPSFTLVRPNLYLVRVGVRLTPFLLARKIEADANGG